MSREQPITVLGHGFLPGNRVTVMDATGRSSEFVVDRVTADTVTLDPSLLRSLWSRISSAAMVAWEWARKLWRRNE